MSNLSKLKREQILDFLAKLRDSKKDDEDALVAINEIENEINEKKYGLVWEKHSEEVDEMMIDNVPILLDDKSREIAMAGNDKYNFLIEGDNLHSLKLLEKTHREAIDVIYIDPPYNTGNNDFMYDDNTVDRNDAFRHSKWLSFMAERLEIAKRLLSDDGVIFISIDDNEFAQLKMLCDDIFTEANYHGMLTWIKKTKPVNMGSAQYSLQSNVEYILVYGAKSQERHNYYLPEVNPKEYPFSDERGDYRVDRVDQRKNIGSMRRDSMLFEMFGIKPKDGFRWQLSPQKRDLLMSQKRLFEKNGSIFVKTYKDEDEKKSGLEPFWTHRSDVPTAESAKENLEKMMNQDDIFQTVKPVELIRQLLLFSTKNDSIVLDFFAGSGTTAQAVLELNKEDGGNRKFILCTNNESGICSDVTFPRIKTVVTGIRPDGSKYSDGIPANVKYYKTEFVAKDSETLVDDLIAHTDEMIQLEYGVQIDKDKYISILTDEEANKLFENWDKYPNIKAIYVSRHVILNAEQRKMFYTKDVYIIPDYYYREELREVGE